MTLVSKYPIKATSDTMSVDPLLLFQQLITVRYRCVLVWTMYLSSSTIWCYWHRVAIRHTISSKCHTGMSTPFKYSNPPRMTVTSTMEMFWSKKYPWRTGQTNESLCGKYTEHFKKEIWPTKGLSAWWLPRWSLYKDNSHLRWKKSSGSNSSYSKEAPSVHCLKMISSRSKWTNWGTFLLGDGMVTPTGTD